MTPAFCHVPVGPESDIGISDFGCRLRFCRGIAADTILAKRTHVTTANLQYVNCETSVMFYNTYSYFLCSKFHVFISNHMPNWLGVIIDKVLQTKTPITPITPVTPILAASHISE